MNLFGRSIIAGIGYTLGCVAVITAWNHKEEIKAKIKNFVNKDEKKEG